MRINGPALKAIRERSGMSRPRLAEIAGIDRSMVTLIETGQRGGSEETILRIACALKVELPAILLNPNVDLTATAAESDQSPAVEGAGRPVPSPAGAATGGAS